jgi:alpha-tubulin suppressor-like RCC1 family protein
MRNIFSSFFVTIGVLICAAACSRDEQGAGPTPNRGHYLLTASPSHTCALRRAGLYCWGENVAGELGTEDTLSSDSPLEASIAADVPNNILALAAATARTCLLRASGEVACLGKNDYGQIGDGTRDAALTLRAAVGVKDAIGLAIEDESSCALHRDGTVSCWGRSPESEPDSGTLTPQVIPDVSSAVELRAGELGTYCARSKAGHVQCWQVKEGVWTAPMDVAELEGAKSIAVPWENEVCAITASDEVRCGDLTTGIAVTLADSADSIALEATGSLSACAKNKAGDWRCWNILPTMLESVGSPAIPITTDKPIRDLVLAGFRMCGIFEDQSVACANANDLLAQSGLLPALEEVSGLPL